MKTVKKLFSLLLVAVLLFSAVPFQASATETPEAFTVQFNYNGHKDTVAIANGAQISGFPTAAAEAAAPAGHHLVGWSLSNGGATVNVADLVASSDITGKNDVIRLYAVYEANPHECNYSDVTVVEPNCQNEGYTRHACECGQFYDDTKTAKTAHEWGNWQVTKEPTEREAGIETRICTVCQQPETRSIGKVTTLVSFISDASGESWDYEFELYQTISSSILPVPQKVVGKKFIGWFNADGVQLRPGDTWSGQYSAYYAKYVDGEDGLSTIKVYARFYVDGVQQGETTYLYSEVFEDGANVLSWLQNHESITYNAIFNIKSTSEYDWNPRYYYNYSGNEPLTSQDLTANGDKSIVVKVYANSTAKARVMLYVHTKANTNPAAIYEMKGYTAGNTVTLTAAQTTIKNATGKTYTLTGLYTDEQVGSPRNPEECMPGVPSL